MVNRQSRLSASRLPAAQQPIGRLCFPHRADLKTKQRRRLTKEMTVIAMHDAAVMRRLQRVGSASTFCRVFHEKAGRCQEKSWAALQPGQGLPFTFLPLRIG